MEEAMENLFASLPEEIKTHIEEITKSSGFPDNEDSLEIMAKAWIEKRDAFLEQVNLFNMEETNFYDKDSEQGLVVMTYSGSLLNIGPLTENGREIKYSSIGLRTDVPSIAKKDHAGLLSPIELDKVAEFENGPVKSTSRILKIAVFKKLLALPEQKTKLNEMTRILESKFIEVNKTVALDIKNL